MTDSKVYKFLPALFLRAPHYSFSGYDLNRLPAVLRQQDFLNAIWLASPGFYRILENKDFGYERLEPRQRHTLHKYYNRICFRPTPFGSFASFSLLEWGTGDPVRLPAGSGGSLHLLPDRQLTEKGGRFAGQNRMADVLVVNPCLYHVHDVFRYFKSVVQADGRYAFTLEAIEAVSFNTELLSLVRTGSAGVDDVLAWIAERGDCTAEEAREYLLFLIQEQVLLTGSTGNVIQADHHRDTGGRLPGWSRYWDKYRVCSLSEPLSLADASAELTGLLPPSSTEGVAQFFYAAAEKRPETGGPAAAGQDRLLGALEVLALLSSAEGPKDLVDFVREFSRRYDQEKVPLLLALDPDTGITYGNLRTPEGNKDHLNDMSFPENESSGPQLDWGPVHQLLFRRWIGDSLRDPWSPLVIAEGDISELESKQTAGLPFPQTQAVMFRNTGEHILIEQAGGVNAVSLIGRFSCFSDAVHTCCRELAAVECKANPEVVFADIGQLSDTHVDNINRRKPVYDYEIPVNVFSGQPAAMQLPPADLVLSVQRNELILESVRLAKRVIPRLATAYNFRHNTLPVFRLLGDLQYQGIKTGFSFDLEQYFPGLAYYPRVCTRDVVISLARWKFADRDLQVLTTGQPADALLVLKDFRRIHHLPRHISLGATDQQLVFDLAVAAEASFFLECIRGMKTVILQEYFYPDRSVISGNKPLAGQFIAFLAHQETIYQGVSSQKNVMSGSVPRRFMAGSEWLYLKIFCSPRVADAILVNVVLPFLNDHREIIRKWFFVRYTEQGYHLRLRLHAAETDLGNMLPELNKRMTAGGYDKMIRNYQMDTYRREIERYSALLIPDMEDLFHCGSELVAWYVGQVAAAQIDWDEFQLGLLTAERMICAFFKADETRLDFIRKITAGFLKEFNADKPFRAALDRKFRLAKPALQILLDEGGERQMLKPLLQKLENLAVLTGDDAMEERVALLADAVHMQLNRTFAVQHREQELLVYYYLEKFLGSRMARRQQKA
jgi:thiopeptide-type bacteriocin biosynthesis protein